MYIIRKRFSDPIYRTGIICIALSLLLFCFHAVAGDEPGDTGKFILNFAITIFYFIYRWIRRKKADRESKIHHRFLFLVLAFISAWALNRDQWTWRWEMVRSKRPQAVVNVTCSSREELQQRIETIIQQKVLSPFFSNKIFE